MVHASDAGGLVVITQTDPIAVVFTIPEDTLPTVLKKIHGGERLPVEAFTASNATCSRPARSSPSTNQIDQTTGTVRLKAEMPNADGTLFRTSS